MRGGGGKGRRKEGLESKRGRGERGGEREGRKKGRGRGRGVDEGKLHPVQRYYIILLPSPPIPFFFSTLPPPHLTPSFLLHSPPQLPKIENTHKHNIYLHRDDES